MRSLYILLLLLFLHTSAAAQQGFAFIHITTDDGMGLASNLVTSLYQDEKGFIWVGTGNGLQRFDGSKFIEMSTSKAGKDNLIHSRLSQIIPADSGKLILTSFVLRKVGLFDPATFIYKPIPIKPSHQISPRSEYRIWKDSKGEIYLTVQDYGILHYNKKENVFVEDNPFPFPEHWSISINGVYENVPKQQYWFACDSGLCIYDRRSKQMWYKDKNPYDLAILKNNRIPKKLTEVYIDQQKRIWLFGWPLANGEQIKLCFDSSGSNLLPKDTIGLNYGPKDYTDYKFFYETKQGEFWVYGFNVLVNYDKNSRRFHYNVSSTGNDNTTIDYESIFQLLEDKDGNIWMATNHGIYYTATGSANASIINETFTDTSGPTAINDILELPNGQLLFASWHFGVTTTNKSLHLTKNNFYRQPPPNDWSPVLKASTRQTLSLYRRPETGDVWVGCNTGVILIHNPDTKTTKYLHPPELNNSPIQYINQDKKGRMWLSTKAGRLVKWNDNKFTLVHDIGTTIYKIFVDRQGWLWIATRERGLYAIDPEDGKVLQHYSENGGKNSLYSNTGTDIEQLQDNTIVFGAGALHFINKDTRTVTVFKYEDGLPSNTVLRLRIDKKGFLWIITTSGLCRYNPNNKRITPYARKDGVVLAEQTIVADYLTTNGYIIFGGSNSILMFNPEILSITQKPPDVTITDFKIFNQYVPVDSLMRNSSIKLNYDQNSLSIYFASLSYRQRDKLTYYYKMVGIDKSWVKADRLYFANYSLLPPGKYIFQIYCENIEGWRSDKITELAIDIKPQFWRTWWFLSLMIFLAAWIIYEVHELRVNKLLAVEALRSRVARDLHDDMGSTLSTISILSSMAKSKINEDALKTNEYLVKISEYSERMMDAMDDIVWSIKPSNDSMQKVTARMREFATNVLEAKEIDFEFVITEDVYDVKLNMEARRDFFLIFKEAVNNAAKYSKANKVLIQLTLQNKKLVLVVKDDGCGFDVDEADGNGLGNMKKRADNMNGDVTIKSFIGKGTTVRLVIPLLL
ncbi:sensor histidine kinase [Segetibacter koreensis]|uniref:sensor histidine kinase n=1 Tax=Segetibacter koreensis TaxID=398037 RepID=UPI0003829618|nr:two-component regulator propeller domain-containing protein [Segetibacter koreensis]